MRDRSKPLKEGHGYRGRAEVVRLDGAAACEVRYHFADRHSFTAYERDHAPRLRAEGMKRFPPERGVRYARRTGEVVYST